MEVLGAVASSIAVVQALIAGKHVVSLVRELPDIQADFNHLTKELALIRSMAKAISKMPPSAYEQDLVNAAAGDLNEVTKELEALLRDCSHEVDTKESKTYRIKKRKWFPERGTIKKLQQRMTNAKDTLHFAVTCSRATNDIQFHSEIRHIVMDLYAMQLLHSDTSDVSPIDAGVREQLADGSNTSALASIAVSNRENKPHMKKMVSMRSLAFMQDSLPGASCQCCCHATEKQYQNSGWVESLFGSWLVRCKSRPQECSNRDCQCLKPTVLRFEYRIPQWIVFRSLAVFASYNSLSGLRCSLRPFKLLDRRSELWWLQEGTSQVVRQSVIDYDVYPGDVTEMGVGLIEFALMSGAYTAMETLIDLWGNVLPEVGLPKRLVFQAKSRLSSNKLGDREVYLLRKLITLIEDSPEDTTTKVHTAVHQREGLQVALEQQPWAVNVIDNNGDTPLILATAKNQISDMEMLISAGANVHMRSPYGTSALMIAVRLGSVMSARLLLRAKSSVEQMNLCETSSLHIASSIACPELVGLLLAAGASATCRDICGRTPLHYLAQNVKANHDDANQIVELLVVAGSDLEAQDNYGYTPIMTCLGHNSITVMKCLLDAGCSLSPSRAEALEHLNSLHLAALHSSLDMLQYLHTMDLCGIDPYQKNSWGNNPWEAFISLSKSSQWPFGLTRRPNTAEGRAFAELYQGVRDRCLRDDIFNLEQVVNGLRNRNISIARDYMGLLLAKYKSWKHEPLVSWYRAVDKRIQRLEWDLATEDVEEYLMELKEELSIQVWKIPSKYGFLFPIDQSPVIEYRSAAKGISL